MPKPKYDHKTMKALIETLLKNPDGIWLSKLAKQAHIPISTTAYYLDNQLKNLVNEHTFGEEKNIIRVVSLKSRVIENLRHGKSIKTIIKLMKIIGEHE